jgi:hypothetical protein
MQKLGWDRAANGMSARYYPNAIADIARYPLMHAPGIQIEPAGD